MSEILEVDLQELGSNLLERLNTLVPVIDKATDRALDISAAAILNRLRTNFLVQKDPFGQPWIPSKAGLARKAAGTGNTMFATGTLFRSIQLFQGEDHERIIGTDVPYAPVHQFGLEGHVQRQFLTLTDEHQALALEVFENEIKKALQ